MNTTGEIRQIHFQDDYYSQVLKLDHDFFPHPWDARDWQSLNWDYHQLWIVLDKSELIGFALISTPPGDDTAHLLKILLNPWLRGSGLATQLWQSMALFLKSQQIKKIFLEVENENQRAKSFYLKMGCQQLRTINGYYSNGSAAVTMLAML